MERFTFKNLFSQFAVSFIVCLVVILLYFLMLPSDYTAANNGADGGDLLSAILTGGIPHPTGYPTYLLFGKLFQLIPLGTPYYKGALLSLVFSSLATGLLSYYFRFAHSDKDNSAASVVAAIMVGIALGTTPLFWSQGVIVEVYGLQSFFMVCILLWLLLIMRGHVSGRIDTVLTILSLIIGLSTGNHVMIVLMTPMVIFAYISAYKNGANHRKLLKYAGLIAAVAVLVYAILPLRARQYPPINWGNPQTIEGFIWLISGKLYHGLAFGLPPADIIQRVGYYANFLLEQFGILGLFIGILGAVKIAAAPGRMKWVYFWVFFIYSIFSIGYLTNDSIVYMIPVLMVFSIWIGAGIQDLWNDFEWDLVLGKAVVCLFFVLLLFRLPDIRDKIDPREDNTARLFVEQCFNTLPQNAILLTNSDSDTFPIWYYHFGLRQRLDIRVIVEGFANFEWYRETIVHTYPDLVFPDRDVSNLSDQFSVLNPQVSVCHTRIDSDVTDSIHCVCPQE